MEKAVITIEECDSEISLDLELTPEPNENQGPIVAHIVGAYALRQARALLMRLENAESHDDFFNILERELKDMASDMNFENAIVLPLENATIN